MSFYNWPIETHQAWNVIAEGKRPLSVPTTNLLVIQYDSPLSRGYWAPPDGGQGRQRVTLRIFPEKRIMFPANFLTS